MSHDPENTLKPLRAVEGDVIALRTGQGGAAAVVRIARAAEGVLRRMLRDDPTAPVDLRLRALSPDDLSSGELLAELRRRDRLPMELAAVFHELAATSSRLAAEGGAATPRDLEVAVAASDGLEQHVLSNPYEAPLQDPLAAREPTLTSPAANEPAPVHAVPASRAAPPWPLIGGALALLALVVLVVVLMTRGRGNDPLRDATTAYSRGDTVRAFSLFLDAARRDPRNPEPHYYMAQIYRLRGRTQEAARELREGLTIAPDDPRLNTELGYLMLDQGRAPQAAERFHSAILLDSTAERAWVGLVTALRRNGQGAQADRVLARAPLNVRTMVSSVRADTPLSAPATLLPGAVPPGAAGYPPDTTGTVLAPLQP
jgi:tetratricopeptide (TPR) repeat protein